MSNMQFGIFVDSKDLNPSEYFFYKSAFLVHFRWNFNGVSG